MPNDKYTGPDGYTSEFYKEIWEIIGTEFTNPIFLCERVSAEGHQLYHLSFDTEEKRGEGDEGL